MDAFEIISLLGGLILLVFGGFCLLTPERAKAAHTKYLPDSIRRGRSATPCQEKIICRMAGAGFLLLAFILLKEIF